MRNPPTPDGNAPSQNEQAARPRKRRLRTLGAGASPQVYAQMAAIAAAENRTLAYLGGQAIVVWLARRPASAPSVKSQNEIGGK